MGAKSLSVGIFFLSFFTFASKGTYQISGFTEMVYKRYYFIERLVRSVDFIKTCTVNEQVIIEVKHDLSRFKNTAIKESIKRMADCKNLYPIEMTWTEFTSFKLLEDESYLDDFTKLILIISEKILLQILPRLSIPPASEIEEACKDGLCANLCDRLHYIDLIYTTLCFLNKEPQKKPFISIEKVYSSYTESVTKRFYYLHRLAKSVSIILNDQTSPHKYFYSCKPTILDSHIVFTHISIHDTIKEMENNLTVKPLDTLWQEFIHYKYIEDELLILELAKLLFILNKNRIFNTYTDIKKSDTLQKLIDFYNKLESLPLEDVLEALDILTNEFPAINEKFEINSNMSWKNWLKKYWWAPPLIFSTFFIKSLITLKHIDSIYTWIKSTITTDENDKQEPLPLKVFF